MKLRPPAKYSVAQDFLKVYAAAHELLLFQRSAIDRLIHLRCSQLPFCPTSLVLNYKNNGLRSPMNMLGAYYTRVGTAVHEVMQTYLPKSGRFLADYVCHECRTIYPMSVQHECCGFDTQYHEVEIDFMGVVGHIDAIFQDAEGNWWILDFKTTSLAGAPKKTKDPGDAYRLQVETYAYLIYRQYGIKVSGVILVFLPRDNPKVPAVWAQPLSDKLNFKAIHRRIKRDSELHAAAMDVETARDLWKLAKHKCSNPYCKYCKLSDSVLKNKIKAAFKRPAPLPMRDLAKLLPPPAQATAVIHHAGHFLPPVKIQIPDVRAINAEELGLKIKRQLIKASKGYTTKKGVTNVA